MSVIAGTLLSSIGSEVSRLAHRMGRTAFLFPEGAIFPLSGFPPCTIKSAIRRDRAEIRFPAADFQRQYSSGRPGAVESVEIIVSWIAYVRAACPQAPLPSSDGRNGVLLALKDQ